MKIWKYTPLDATMLGLSVGQFMTTLLLAASWKRTSLAGRVGEVALLVFMMVYNIIVISHLFTHAPWFNSRMLNGLASMLNSCNIGQSVQAYQFAHVRNHHRYHNDQKGPDGKTKDWSSTFQDGVGGEHANLLRYACVGAISTLLNEGRALLSVTRLWRVGRAEQDVMARASESVGTYVKELRQVQLDRMAHFLAVCLLVSISWRWTLLCYVPAFYLALALVNVQNYYEHYGAAPDSRYANSVSYYGALYNVVTFNDGYHQEHHLRSQGHWRSMPMVRRQYGDRMDREERIISPVPAILGIFDRHRKQLHRRGGAAGALKGSMRNEGEFTEAAKGA